MLGPLPRAESSYAPCFNTKLKTRGSLPDDLTRLRAHGRTLPAANVGTGVVPADLSGEDALGINRITAE